MSKKVSNPSLSALPLGGVGECGSLNMMVYECNGDLIVVDAGIGFPQPYTPGIDAMIPDISYLRQNLNRLKGLFITHAHEDHIGAVHYLWEELQCPVYLTQFARLVLEDKLEQVGLKDEVPLHTVKTGDRVQAGNLEVEFVGISHSIPESHALMVRTEHGNILHTGDYKFDNTAPAGCVANADYLTKIGDEGVLAMFADSTSVAIKGKGVDEKTVQDNMQQLVAGMKNRVYFCTTASHIARICGGMEAAVANGRKVAIFGRSMQRRVENAKECGFIKPHLSKNIVDIDEAMKLPKDKVFIIVTGSQAQTRAALWRLSRGDLHKMSITPGDDVILSSLWIPGNEREISKMVSNLAYEGAEVHHIRNNRAIYASGHPYEDDVKEMYERIRPEIMVPVHGDFAQMKTNIKLAKSMGIAQQFMIEDGRKLHLAPEKAYVTEDVIPVGRNYVDGYNILDEDRFILRDRVKLSETGMATVTVAVEKQTGELVAGPTIKTKGIIDEKLQPEVVELAENMAKQALENQFPDGVINKPELAEEMIRQSVRRAFQKERGRKPITVATVLEV